MTGVQTCALPISSFPVTIRKDSPCRAGSRVFTDSPLSVVMDDLRLDSTITGQTCAGSLNTNGSQTIVFSTLPSSTVIPSSVTQVGIDITLTGGQSAVFEGARGYFVFLGDDYSYGFDLPIEFKKSDDGVIGARISSVDPSMLVNVQGSPIVVVTAPYRDWETDRKSTRLNSSHRSLSRMPSSA